MLKKLQNLLFEEDEDDIEDEEEEEVVTPVRTKTAPRHVEAEPVKPVRQTRVIEEEPAPAPVKTMQRIDVTQPIATAKPKPVTEEVSESLFKEEEVVAPKPKKLGITVDDIPAEKPAKPVEKKPVAVKPAVKKEKETVKPAPVKSEPGYMFKPVISPIFGVDEKDLHALKTTTNKISEAEKQKSTGIRPQIISPIYGADQENSPSSIRDTVEQSDALESVIGNAKNMAAEDTIPEFSLDDILKVRDEEVKEEKKNAEETVQFPDLDFDDDTMENTVLFKRNDVKK